MAQGWRRSTVRAEAARSRMASLQSTILASNLTRRVDFALFMVEALTNDTLIHEAPAIVGRLSPSALTHSSTSAAAGGRAIGCGELGGGPEGIHDVGRHA